MRRFKKRATAKRRGPPAAFGGDPIHDGPHDAIDRELLGIWLSVSRLRQMIREQLVAADGLVVPLQQQAAVERATGKKSMSKKPRRKAA